MPGAMGGGLIRKYIAEQKKEKVQEEVEEIHALTRQYLPFNQAKFVSVLRTGKVDFERDGTSGDTLILNNYAKPGDQLRLMLNRTTMQIDRISVRTYLDQPQEMMTVDVRFSILADGTTYPALTSIAAPSMKLSIYTLNSNYSKAVY